MSSFFFTTPFSNSATSQSGASGSVPALPSDTRISQLRLMFSSRTLAFSSSINVCLLRVCNRTAKIINHERVESPVGDSCHYAICWRVRVRQQTKEGQPMSTSKAVNQLKGKWIYRSLVNDK